MLMTNDNVRLFPHDPLMRVLFVRWLPRWVRPNHFTVIRFLFTPVVLYVLWQGRWLETTGLFLFAAFTDVLDGSTARLRKQITMWGTVADPIADKLLIGSVSLLFVARVIGLWLAIAILLMEVLVISGVLYRRYRGKMSSANVFGKTKMLLQVTAIFLLLLSQILNQIAFVPIALVFFLISFFFAFISFLTYSS
jgi:CDP-diacylglycerol--glycerol-3-phosphate 3-phosphatidyltransferase